MTPSPVASLLVAALVVLRQPCARNKATARLLLERAAEYDSLSPAEREACRDLADDLDIEHQALLAHLAPPSLLVHTDTPEQACAETSWRHAWRMPA
ncbi:hypothetical protein [Thiobacillus sp.]